MMPAGGVPLRVRLSDWLGRTALPKCGGRVLAGHQDYTQRRQYEHQAKVSARYAAHPQGLRDAR